MPKRKPEPEAPIIPKIPKDLVRWHCPDCGIYCAGFVPIDMEGPPQICRGNGREGGVCNGLMEQVYRGAA